MCYHVRFETLFFVGKLRDSAPPSLPVCPCPTSIEQRNPYWGKGGASSLVFIGEGVGELGGMVKVQDDFSSLGGMGY